MPRQRTKRWYFPWVPLSILAGVGIVVATLFFIKPPQAEAATPEPFAGFQTTDKLVLTVSLPPTDKRKITGPLSVELVGPDGKVLAAEQRTVEASPDKTGHRFEFGSLKVPADKVTLRCTFDGQKVETPLTKILLVKAHETAVSSGQEFFAGSTASLRCEVHGVKTMTETVPLPGATVAVSIKDKEGKATSLYDGKAGQDGVADVQFKVPALAPGTYKMEIATKSTLGEEKLEREVKVKTAPKVLLVTDKPLYQPGQLIHLRALALQGFDLSPVAAAALTFEVEDAKGNKVFKRELKTSEYGIVSADFQLADEVNQGDYRIRAILGDHTSDKTVTVKPYVLPKFKAEVKADKRFYLPKETIKGELQSDYFFGKPVAGSTVKITASTFDVAFKDFQTIDTKTDKQGHATFEVKLPDYFVGQPLDKGNALVKLEIKVTDTADHTETVTKTFPVSNQSVNVSLIPEGGRLVPGMENRVFAAAIYPDGSPVAGCKVALWQGQQAKDKPFVELKTNDAGLADFKLTPKAEQFRAGDWANRKVEMLGGQVIDVMEQKNLFDLAIEAKDAKGATAKTTTALTSEPFGENVLLHLDKPIYKGGETVNVDVHTSAGLPTVYLDVIRGGQTLLTKWLDVKDGNAAHKLDLPPGAFGSLEIHAYQMLPSGEIIRDSRVIYVHNPVDLKIDVKPDETEYKPGQKGTITFQVTDSKGKPAAAALGVIIVDEAVYALQEMQPGLEKVYFTLQEELLKPQVQPIYKGDTIDNIIRDPVPAAEKQQIAEVLLTGVHPKVPQRWETNPAQERRQKLENLITQIGWSMYQYTVNNNAGLVLDKKNEGLTFKSDILKDLVNQGWINAEMLTDPMGGKVTLESLAKMEKGFTPDRLGRAITSVRMQNMASWVGAYADHNKAKFFKDDKWTLPDSILADAAKHFGVDKMWYTDAWGRPLKLVKLDKKWDHQTGHGAFDMHTLVSAGPDGKFDTDDDVKMPRADQWGHVHVWWTTEDARHLAQAPRFNRRWRGWERGEMEMLQRNFDGRPGLPVPGAPGGPGGGGDRFKDKGGDEKKDAKDGPRPTEGAGTGVGVGGGAGEAPVMRMREYFPETMLWKPALITDEKGIAKLDLDFADSITTWRLTASASSKGGALGGTTTPLRVFQDFFVDLDLPVALTQNDEVAFPVAVYNYLKTPQTVRLKLKQEEWFELVDGQGYERSLDLKANEVTSIKFRIRAKKNGNFPLTVEARGSKMSDALKRSIDVQPDGKKVEQVVSDRLSGTQTQQIIIPDNAIPDASRLYVKVYPGVFSQVLEGTEGLIRLPGG
jgi:5-hydroxyisourate hydrolase-like protein (transthyretin family)